MYNKYRFLGIILPKILINGSKLMTTGSPGDFFLVYFSPQSPENLTLVISF